MDKYIVVLLSIILPGAIGFFGLIGLTRGLYSSSSGVNGELIVYTPPVLAKIVEEFSGFFEERYGVRVNVVVDSTGRLLTRLETTMQGDILITADHYFMEEAVKRGLVDPESTRRISIIVPVVLFHRDSSFKPLDIRDLPRLSMEGAKIAIADPKASPFGRMAYNLLVKTSVYSVLENRLYVYSDVGVVARYLSLGEVDIAILPHIVKYWYPSELEIVWLKPEDISGIASCQLIGITRYAVNKGLAGLFIEEFTRYASSLDPVRTGFVYNISDLSKIAPYDYRGIELPVVCSL